MVAKDLGPRGEDRWTEPLREPRTQITRCTGSTASRPFVGRRLFLDKASGALPDLARRALDCGLWTLWARGPHK